jgi:hypothetical protein
LSVEPAAVAEEQLQAGPRLLAALPAHPLLHRAATCRGATPARADLGQLTSRTPQVASCLPSRT